MSPLKATGGSLWTVGGAFAGNAPASATDSAVTKIGMWGDSITFGGQDGTGATWPAYIDAAITGSISVYNGGVSGNTSPQIRTRLLGSEGSTWRDGVAILAAGRNNLILAGGVDTQINTLIGDTAAMVNGLTGTKSYLVLSVHTNVTEGTSGGDMADYVTIKRMNDQLAATYGARYLDTRRYLIDNGLAVNGLTATAGDLADIAKDTIPRALLVPDDGIHPNQYGYRAMAICILNKMVSMGWIASYATPPLPAPATEPAISAPLLLNYDASKQTAANGTTLTQLTDQSGNGWHATLVASAGSQVISYDTTGYNGKPAFDFPGAKYMDTATFPALTGIITAIWVAKHDVVASTRYVIGSVTGSLLGLGSVSTNGAWLVMRGTLLAVGTADTSPHLFRAVLGVGAGASSLYVDETVIGQNSNAGVANPAAVRIGAGGSATGFFDGKLAEVRIYNGALTTGDTTSLMAFLTSKWAA